jgi:hypothetical protein
LALIAATVLLTNKFITTIPRAEINIHPSVLAIRYMQDVVELRPASEHRLMLIENDDTWIGWDKVNPRNSIDSSY